MSEGTVKVATVATHRDKEARNALARSEPIPRKDSQPGVVAVEDDALALWSKCQLAHPRVDVLKDGRFGVLGDVENGVKEGGVRAGSEGFEAREGDCWCLGNGGEGERMTRVDDPGQGNSKVSSEQLESKFGLLSRVHKVHLGLGTKGKVTVGIDVSRLHDLIARFGERLTFARHRRG